MSFSLFSLCVSWLYSCCSTVQCQVQDNAVFTKLSVVSLDVLMCICSTQFFLVVGMLGYLIDLEMANVASVMVSKFRSESAPFCRWNTSRCVCHVPRICIIVHETGRSSFAVLCLVVAIFCSERGDVSSHLLGCEVMASEETGSGAIPNNHDP